MTDWPYVYIDDAARAAVSACFAKGRKQLSYFIAHSERVTPDDIAAAAAAAGKPVRLEVDTSKPLAARGPVDTDAPARDFGFRAKVGSPRGHSPHDRRCALARHVAGRRNDGHSRELVFFRSSNSWI